MNNEVSLQVIHQGFEWRALLHKPLRYIIQLFSGNYCHTSTRIKRANITQNGVIEITDRTYDFTGVGGRDMLTESWVGEYKDYKKLKIYRYNIIPPITDEQVTKMVEYFYKTKDRDYDATKAAISVLSTSKIEWLERGGEYCSINTLGGFCYAKISQPNYKDPLQDPNELVRWFKKQGLIKDRIRIK